eukprot:10197529-Alexandrium_andersonii.AAC.1
MAPADSASQGKELAELLTPPKHAGPPAPQPKGGGNNGTCSRPPAPPPHHRFPPAPRPSPRAEGGCGEAT